MTEPAEAAGAEVESGTAARPAALPLRLAWDAEEILLVTVLTLMCALPLTEIVSRQLGIAGVNGSTVFVQHLTLWTAFLGAALAARSNRLLAMSANTFLPERWKEPARNLTGAIAAAISLCLAYGSFQLVYGTREGGAVLAAGIPTWVAQLAMPVGLLLVALRLMWRTPKRWLALCGLLVPVILGFTPQYFQGWLLWPGIGVLLVAALLGLPIFATLGGIALLLFFGDGLPAASVPVETYALVVNPILPSLPLFTFAGYILVEGGASRRLLRVYSALLGWMPGGLTITTAVVCAIFTWAGSGVTIMSLGGLLLPMLVRARYPERFSMGLINASGSLGLLFPPSVPIILFGVYAHTDIKKLFIGGLLPGLLLVSIVCAYGIFVGLRSGAERSRFSWAEASAAVWAAKWELIIPVVVLVGLFGGLGTYVEAGAITVFAALVVEALVYKDLSLWRDYRRVALECVSVIGGVLLIVGIAVGFTNYMVTALVPDKLAAWVYGHIESKYVFLLLLNLLLLVKGSFMDVFSAIIVLVPLLAPLARRFGIDEVQFGIIFISNLELGYLTPPVGMNLCLSAYRFKQPMTTIYRSTLVFYFILLAGVLVITYVPWLTTAPVRWLSP